MKHIRIVIVGTGTGVGKTHVGCSLLAAARERGLRLVGLKPIESGAAVAPGPDAAALLAAHGGVVGDQPYCLPEPISPHLAARRAGIQIDLAKVVRWVAGHGEPAIVETAGGLLSPLTRSETNLDLTTALHPDATVVVSTDRLGVLHDVAAVLLALRTAALVPRGIALNAAESPDASSSTNAGELEELHGTPVISFPRAAFDAPASLASANRLLDLLL